MQIISTKKFEKQYLNLPKKTKEQFKKRLKLFKKEKNNPLLKSHKLHGKYENIWSININSDIRALYIIQDKEIVKFIEIGSHSELYF